MKSNTHTTIRNIHDLEQALGLTPAQGAEIELHAELCKKLIGAVQRSGLTHARVAKLAGTSRTRLTAILNGNLQGVSTDLLLRILASLGYRAKITLTKAKPAA